MCGGDLWDVVGKAGEAFAMLVCVILALEVAVE